MAKAVKLADIAERLSVSTVTVSKALSGEKGVSEELREKIKIMAQEMGYKKFSAKKIQNTGKSYNIGVLIASRYLDKCDSFYWQMYQQTAMKAVSKGCFTLMECVQEDAEKKGNMPILLQEQKADGLIIIGRMRAEYLNILNKKANVPLLYLDFYTDDKMADAVISDSYYGAYQLVNYLFDMGHQKIGYVGTILSTSSITDRYLGYMKSMLEHGEEIKEEWVLKDRDKETVIIDAARYMNLPKEMPTAFFCNCDLTASYLIKKLRENGYRVPEDISVIGYDNYLSAGLCDVKLTTYEVDMKEMARRAIHMMIKKLNGETYRQGICIVEGHLVIRDSVKKLK